MRSLGQISYKPLVEFEDVAGGDANGCILKAGLQSSATTEDGIGTGATLSGSPTLVFANGGCTKTSLNAGYILSSVPAAYATSLQVEGRLQFDMLLADTAVPANASINNSRIIEFRDAGAVQLGPVVAFSGKSDSVYRGVTNGYGGDPSIENAIAISADSAGSLGFCNTNEARIEIILHSGTPTYADGFVRFTLSWNRQILEWYVNGTLVSWMKRPRSLLTTAFTTMRLFAAAVQLGTMRNFILMDRACINPADLPTSKRISFMGHSFLGSYGALGWRDNLTSSGWVNDSVTTSVTGIDLIFGAVIKNFAGKVKILNASYGGITLTNVMNFIDGTSAWPYKFRSEIVTTGLAVTGTGSVATVTHTAHKKQTGDFVIITQSNPAGYNTAGSTGAKITVVDVDTYTYASAGTGAATCTSEPAIVDRVVRFKPHICVLTCVFNESDIPTMETKINAINVYLTDRGIVPLWLIEQSGNVSGGAGKEAYVAAAIAQIQADEAAIGDIGYIDTWTATLDPASVTFAPLPKYVESISPFGHPSVGCQVEVLAPMLVAELNRLFATPPAYAWWCCV